MKQAYIITSAIETTADPLTYSSVRSVFGSEERLRQTVMSVASIDQAAGQDASIYLIDTSDNWQPYEDFFRYQSNLKFVSVKKEFPNIWHEATTHANKSRCEALITENFFKSYQHQLQSHDCFVKISGRYFLDSSFDTKDIQKDKMCFKRAWEFEWQDWWNYHAVREPGSQVLRQYCSALFAWGAQQHQVIVSIYNQILQVLSQPDCQHYDMETLLYFYSIPYRDKIIETDWRVYGWLGPNGKFVRQ